MAAEAKRLIVQAAALLRAGYCGPGALKQSVNGIPVLLSGNFESDRLVVLSPGFASSLTDYEAVVKALENRALVVRVFHEGNGRKAGLSALFRYLVWRFFRGLRPIEAAKKVRAHIHRPENRRCRVDQLKSVLDGLCTEFPRARLSLIGHSYGTDTALQAALHFELSSLVLLSPHPPGYLFKEEDYGKLRARRVVVITGTRDWTRDGVGPSERLRVADFLSGEMKVARMCLEGVGHMDFALSALGPTGWEAELKEILDRWV